MHRGYTKRWRKRWDKGYHKDQLLWAIMDYFIDFATYQDKDVFRKGVGNISLKRGQWHFTTRELADFFAVDRQRIRTCLKTLKSNPFLTLKPTRKYTIATVINYDIYNPLDECANPQLTRDLTNSQPTTNPLALLYLLYANKVNKVKNTNNGRKRSWPKDFCLTDDKRQYAVKKGIDPDKLDDFWEDFHDSALSKGYLYKDWEAAFRNRVKKAQEYGKQFLKQKDPWEDV